MAHITANDLKTRGIAAIEASLGGGRTEAVVSVRGADRYVVMELAQYQRLRECELEAALAESRADIAAGRFVVESPAQHVARLQTMIADADDGAPAVPAKRRATPAAAAQPAARKGTGPAARRSARPKAR
jgi:hypothetical protein